MTSNRQDRWTEESDVIVGGMCAGAVAAITLMTRERVLILENNPVIRQLKPSYPKTRMAGGDYSPRKVWHQRLFI